MKSDNWIEDIRRLRLPPLSAGSHDSPEKGLCAMEMVAYIERLPHSDRPQCTCPVIAAFVRGINDAMGDADRKRLLAYLPRLVGTVSPAHERERAGYLALWAVRVCASRALDAAGLRDHAAKCRETKTLVDADAATATAAAAAGDGVAYAGSERAVSANSVANAAAYSAGRAVHAAYVAHIAAAAAYAADAALVAAEAVEIWPAALDALDGVLAIGPSGGWTQYDTDRARELESLA